MNFAIPWPTLQAEPVEIVCSRREYSESVFPQTRGLIVSNERPIEKNEKFSIVPDAHDGLTASAILLSRRPSWATEEKDGGTDPANKSTLEVL